MQSVLEEISQRNAELNDKLLKQAVELDDMKTAAAVAELVKRDEIENERCRCAEEVATLQQLMKGLFSFSVAFVSDCNLFLKTILCSSSWCYHSQEISCVTCLLRLYCGTKLCIVDVY